MIGESAFNLSTVYGSVRDRYNATVQALRNVPFYTYGLIKVDIQGDDVVFKITSTGETKGSVEEAIAAAQRSKLGEIVSFSSNRVFAGETEAARRLVSQYGTFENIMVEIGQKLFDLNSTQRAELLNAGIDVDALDLSLRADILTFSPQEGTSTEIASIMNKSYRRDGRLMGIPVVDAKGARLIQFRVGDQILDLHQSNLIMTMAGHSISDGATIMKAILSAAGGDFSVEPIASMLEKQVKRERAFLTSRDISLSGSVLEDVLRALPEGHRTYGSSVEDVLAVPMPRLGFGTGDEAFGYLTTEMSRAASTAAGDLSRRVLILDPQYEILKIFSGQQEELNDDILAFYKGKFGVKLREGSTFLEDMQEAARTYVYNILDLSVSDLSITSVDDAAGVGSRFEMPIIPIMERLKNAISSFSEDTTGAWSSDSLKKYLLEEFSDDLQMQRVVQTVFKSISQAFDGADLLNRRFLEGYLDYIRGERTALGETLHELSGADKKARIQVMDELDNLIRVVEKGELGQITGRGNIYVEQLRRFMNIKNAWDAKSAFEGRLSPFAAVITKESIKPDTEFAGDVSSLVIEGLGIPDDKVYADAVTAAFLPEIYGDAESLAAMRSNMISKLDELNQVIETGILPQKLRATIHHQANIDLNLISPERRHAVSMSKQFAQDIQRLILSGQNPRNNPLMATMLHNFYATQAFTERKGRMYPIVPEVNRFQIDTERLENRLGTGFEELSGQVRVVRGEGAEATMTSLDIANGTRVMQFRVSGHKMFIPDQGVSIFYHAEGGFDLDDKLLDRMILYEQGHGDEFRKRLGFFTYRQPTGQDEIAFLRLSKMDTDSVRAIFSKDYMVEALRQVRTTKTGPELDRLNELYKVISSTRGRLSDEFSDDYESLMVEVWERAAANKKTGIKRLSESAAKKIFGYNETTGEIGPRTSPLQVSDLYEEFTVTDRITGETRTSIRAVDPKYERAGIQKIFLENGAFDMSAPIRDVVGTYNLPEPVKAAIISAAEDSTSLDPNDLQRRIFAALSEQVDIGNMSMAQARSIVDTAANEMRVRAMATADGFIGQYVNRSMVVGSTLNQYEEFLSAMPLEVQTFMRENFKIGILASETAIDLSQTFSVAKRIEEEVRRTLAQAASYIGDEEGVNAAIRKITGTSGNVGISEIGVAQIESLGRLIGFSRAVSGSLTADQADLLMGVDLNVLIDRLNKDDKRRFLTSIIQGTDLGSQIASGSITGPGITPDLIRAINLNSEYLERMDDARQILAEGSFPKIQEVLEKEFGLTASHRFAVNTKINELGNMGLSYFESNRRARLRNLPENTIDLMAETGEKEISLAKAIVDKNKDLLDEVFVNAVEDRASMSALEKFYLSARRVMVANQVLTDIGAALGRADVTGQRLFNALDQVIGRTKYDIFNLTPLIDNETGEISSELHKHVLNSWQTARDKRLYEHFLSLDASRQVGMEPTPARRVFDLLSDTEIFGPISEDRNERSRQLYERANELLELSDDIVPEYMSSDLVSLEESNILKTLAEQTDLIENEFARRQATIEAQIVDAMANEAMLDDAEFLDEALGAAPEEAFYDVDYYREAMEDLDRVVRAAEEVPPVEGASYSRVSESLDDIKALWNDTLFRKTTLGIGAVILASFAYTSIKDRTHEDVSGPPLLPGGSAYESDYPKYRPSVAEIRNQGYSSGNSYNVSISGGQDQVDRFNEALGGLTNGDVNTTMYTGAPNLGGSIFDKISGIF